MGDCVLEQKESCGWEPSVGFRAHALALASIYFYSLGPGILMELKPKERKAELQFRSRLGILGVCVPFYHQVLCKQWPRAYVQPRTPGGRETDILMGEREHPALRHSRPVSRVDVQMFNNWQGECTGQSEWSGHRATGLEQGPSCQA